MYTLVGFDTDLKYFTHHIHNWKDLPKIIQRQIIDQSGPGHGCQKCPRDEDVQYIPPEARGHKWEVTEGELT